MGISKYPSCPDAGTLSDFLSLTSGFEWMSPQDAGATTDTDEPAPIDGSTHINQSDFPYLTAYV